MTLISQVVTPRICFMSETRQASRPITRIGRMGPFSLHAQSHRVCFARFKCAAASDVGIAARVSCASGTS